MALYIYTALYRIGLKRTTKCGDAFEDLTGCQNEDIYSFTQPSAARFQMFFGSKLYE